MSSYDSWKCDPEYRISAKELERTERLQEAEDRAERAETLVDELAAVLVDVDHMFSEPGKYNTRTIASAVRAAITKALGRAR